VKPVYDVQLQYKCHILPPYRIYYYPWILLPPGSIIIFFYLIGNTPTDLKAYEAVLGVVSHHRLFHIKITIFHWGGFLGRSIPATPPLIKVYIQNVSSMGKNNSSVSTDPPFTNFEKGRFNDRPNFASLTPLSSSNSLQPMQIGQLLPN